MIASLALLSFIARTPQATMDISRIFIKGTKLAYKVRSHMTVEQQEYGINTFLPEDIDINYDFDYTVKDVKPEGFAELLYHRPTMTFVAGDTAESAAKEHIQKVDQVLDLNVSPINEITDMKDLTDPKKKKEAEDGGGEFADLRLTEYLRPFTKTVAPVQAGIIARFAGELQRMALFIGDVNSSMDFNPKLPLDEAKVGTTWKRTISYQPQTVKGSKGKQAVQRIDMVYKYEGLTTSDNRKVHRVSATATVDTDAALFINQMLEMKPSESGLKALKLKMKTDIVFDLDEKTRDTLKSVATANGYWNLELTQLKDQAYAEQKITGTTTMTLAGKKQN